MKRSKKEAAHAGSPAGMSGREEGAWKITGVYMGGEDGEPVRLEGEEAQAVLDMIHELEEEAEGNGWN